MDLNKQKLLDEMAGWNRKKRRQFMKQTGIRVQGVMKPVVKKDTINNGRPI